MWGLSYFVWPNFLGQAGVGHDPRLCTTFPVGSPFTARRVSRIERLPGAFDIAYASASQCTLLSFIFLRVPIFPNFAVRGVYRSPLLCILLDFGIFSSPVEVLFPLTSLVRLWRVSKFRPEYLSHVTPTPLRVDTLYILFFLCGHIPR